VNLAAKNDAHAEKYNTHGKKRVYNMRKKGKTLGTDGRKEKPS